MHSSDRTDTEEASHGVHGKHSFSQRRVWHTGRTPKRPTLSKDCFVFSDGPRPTLPYPPAAEDTQVLNYPQHTIVLNPSFIPTSISTQGQQPTPKQTPTSLRLYLKLFRMYPNHTKGTPLLPLVKRLSLVALECYPLLH